MIYLDSSLLLSRYLGESRSEDATAIWVSEDDLVSSALTMVEIVVTLRRAAGSPPKSRARAWLKSALQHVQSDLKLVSLTFDMAGPADLVWRDERLSACRSSDALHVATALWFHRETGRTVRFASFDERQREVALRCGLPILPG